MADKGKLIIRMIRSPIDFPFDQKATLRALGLRKIGDEITKPDNPSIWGMIRKIKHLVEVEKLVKAEVKPEEEIKKLKEEKKPEKTKKPKK